MRSDSGTESDEDASVLEHQCTSSRRSVAVSGQAMGYDDTTPENVFHNIEAAVKCIKALPDGLDIVVVSSL